MNQPKKAAAVAAKKPRKATRFHGTDHWLTREQFAALCAASEPMYATLWKLMVSHALRISEALALRADDVAGGFLTIQRLKGSQRTRQPLLVDLSAQVASGTYRLFPIHRSSAFLHFRKAAAAIGLHPDLRHPHVLRHTTAHWMLNGGAALNVTSQYLGHTSLASTAAYLNCSDALASAAAASIIGRGL